MGGIRAITSPAFRGITDPFGTYSSFSASVMYSSLDTSGASLGYFSANEVLWGRGRKTQETKSIEDYRIKELDTTPISQ